MYALSDYDYHLPEGLIAQQPAVERERSRLFCLQRQSGQWSHNQFADIVQWVDAGDVLVMNNTKVIPGRLLGRKESGGKVEVLILDYAQGIGEKIFQCLIKSSKRPKLNSLLFFDRGVTGRVISVSSTTCRISFEDQASFDRVLWQIGHVPLPPYIQRPDSLQDRRSYQTVYAACEGAIAAPTAGLHFTKGLLDQLKRKGVELVYLTLHVGYGTFVPVRVDDIRSHRMHAEWFTLSTSAAEAINGAKAAGRRVVAVGTTSVRTLENCAVQVGTVRSRSGMCDLFIYPGYEFKIVDAMITNFHLPQSTLIMLVSAFAGRRNVLRAYAEAVREQYRFFSYGDAMLIT